MARVLQKRPKIGDVIEIATPKGLAYAQYTHKHVKPPRWGYLIRVLPGLFHTRPTVFSELVRSEERFFVFFPLGAAVARDIVGIVAHEEIPERVRPFPLMRASGGIRDKTGRAMSWWLWNGERDWKIGKLSPEQCKLLIQTIVNDVALVDMIVSGWSPEDDI